MTGLAVPAQQPKLKAVAFRLHGMFQPPVLRKLPVLGVHHGKPAKLGKLGQFQTKNALQVVVDPGQ